MEGCGSVAEDRRLARLTKIVLTLPGAERETHGTHAAFLVRKRRFAYFLDDHHGDGIVALSCRAAPGENTALIASDPERYYMPSYVGPRGWVALRLDVGSVDWEEVRELVTDAYRLTAPKRLAALLSPR
jgi:phosphoribosylglycinamide formyltransferase-1